MADSQVPFPYDEAALKALRKSLSEPRFATYLKKADGNEAYALALYLYNARLAKAFLFPLHVCEVTLRNAVDEVLVRKFGENWHLNDAFQTRTLNCQSRQSLKKALKRADCQRRGKVVAQLTFDFWSNLFRSEYANLWRTEVNVAFPGLGRTGGRKRIQSLAKEINDLRNRIAHHEPIFGDELSKRQENMVDFVRLRCPVTSGWMKHHSTVDTVMSSEPTAAGVSPDRLDSRSDASFFPVTTCTTLLELAERSGCTAFVCLEGNRVVGAFTHQQMMHFVLKQAAAESGLVALGDHRVADLLSEPDIRSGYRTLDGSAPFGKAVEILRERQTRVLVAVSGADGVPVGVIVRAHLLY